MITIITGIFISIVSLSNGKWITPDILLQRETFLLSVLNSVAIAITYDGNWSDYVPFGISAFTLSSCDDGNCCEGLNRNSYENIRMAYIYGLIQASFRFAHVLCVEYFREDKRIMVLQAIASRKFNASCAWMTKRYPSKYITIFYCCTILCIFDSIFSQKRPSFVNACLLNYQRRSSWLILLQNISSIMYVWWIYEIYMNIWQKSCADQNFISVYLSLVMIYHIWFTCNIDINHSFSQ